MKTKFKHLLKLTVMGLALGLSLHVMLPKSQANTQTKMAQLELIQRPKLVRFFREAFKMGSPRIVESYRIQVGRVVNPENPNKTLLGVCSTAVDPHYENRDMPVRAPAFKSYCL